MKIITTGNTRVVCEFKNNVVKIPKFNLAKSFLNLYLGFKTGDKNTSKDFLFSISRGIRANLNEFSNQNKDIEKYIAKTKISIFGLLNIQEKLEMKKIGHLKPLDHLIKNNIFNEIEVLDLGHTLFVGDNYGFNDEGQVKMCDYGHKSVNKILKLHGEEIIENYKDSLEILNIK